MIQQIYTTPTPFTGKDVTIENSGKGYTSNMVIKGQTYQNLVKRIKSHGDKWIDNGDNFSINVTSTEGQSTIIYEFAYVLKKNAQYTLIVNMKSYTTGYPHLCFMDANNTIATSQQWSPTQVGIQKFVFTTDANNDSCLLRILNRNEVDNNYSIGKEIILLEGDWTNKEVPSSITGIESVGEKEGNKISILSHAANVINPQKLFSNNNKILKENDEFICPADVSWQNEKVKGLDLTKPIYFAYEIKADEDITIDSTNSNLLVRLDYIKTGGNIGGTSIALGTKITNKYTKLIFKNIVVSQTNSEKGINLVFRNGVGKRFYVKNITLTNTPIDDIVPYKEDKKEILIGLDIGLKSLPNGVADAIEQREDGVYLVQRIGKKLLNGSESWTLRSSNDNFIKFTSSDLTNYKEQTFNLYCNNFTPNSNATMDIIKNEYIFNGVSGGGYNIILVINKNKLKTQDVEGLKEWLQANPTILYYELATPIETKLDINNINLQTFKDVTYVLSNNSIKPTLSFKAPILGYKTINPIQLKTTQNGTEVNVYPYSTPELITFGDNETLADKINNLGNTHTHNNATVTTDGFMSKESYAKLESLTEYTHPSTHAATMISQDASHRFVTDAEKNNWNAKASTNVATSSTNGLMSNTDKQKLDRISNSFDIVYDANTETIRFRFR